MTTTKAQGATDDFWCGTTKPNRSGLVSSTITLDTANTIREALSLLHRVQSCELKALARGGPSERDVGQAIDNRHSCVRSYDGMRKALVGYWDAAPSTPTTRNGEGERA